MVTKIFPAAYVDGIRDVSHAGTLSTAGASRAGPGAKTASRSRNLVVSRGTNGSNPTSSSGESRANLSFRGEQSTAGRSNALGPWVRPGRVTKLKRAEITQPGCPGCEAGEAKEQIGACHGLTRPVAVARCRARCRRARIGSRSSERRSRNPN